MNDQYKLLDLFCGAGGASMGYHWAGFEVIGVDINPQPHYPFKFYQADALSFPLDGFDAVHASPPCQRWSTGSHHRDFYPDLLTPIRERFQETNNPYVIENVPGAPLRADFTITGDIVGLTLIKRRRLFETNWFNSIAWALKYPSSGPVITVTGHGTTSGNRASWGRNIRTAEMRVAMGIDWMNRDELSQAIPPAYTEYIGKHLLRYLMYGEPVDPPKSSLPKIICSS